MKILNILILLLIVVFISCKKGNEDVAKNQELGERLYFTKRAGQNIGSRFMAESIDEVGVKGKRCISKKKYVDSVKRCPGGFGLCKGTVGTYTKPKISALNSNNFLGRVTESSDELISGFEAYTNFLKIEFENNNIPSDFNQESFYFKETIDNSQGLFLNGESFKSFEIIDGTYTVNRPVNGKPYLLLPYRIIK